MSCNINSDGSSTCCSPPSEMFPDGNCTNSPAITFGTGTTGTTGISGLPAPRMDYSQGDIISKQFSDSCGPFGDNGMCKDVLTTFQGTITGQVQLGKSAPKQYEVEWHMGPGTPSYTVKSFVNPQNIFSVSDATPQSSENCPIGTTFQKGHSIRCITAPCPQPKNKCVSSAMLKELALQRKNEELMRRQMELGFKQVNTAGTSSKSILPMIIIGGIMYYLYTKNK